MWCLSNVSTEPGDLLDSAIWGLRLSDVTECVGSKSDAINVVSGRFHFDDSGILYISCIVCAV